MKYIVEIKKYYNSDEIKDVFVEDTQYPINTWVSKSVMIKYMLSHPYETIKTRYFKNGYWHEGEIVRVVDNRYLRTDSNNIKADNLGEL